MTIVDAKARVFFTIDYFYSMIDFTLIIFELYVSLRRIGGGGGRRGGEGRHSFIK